jgi:hypothetical protein
MTFLLTTLADEIIEYIFMSQVGLANVVRGLPALRDEPVDDPPGRQNASKRPSSLRFPHRFKSFQVVFFPKKAFRNNIFKCWFSFGKHYFQDWTN